MCKNKWKKSEKIKKERKNSHIFVSNSKYCELMQKEFIFYLKLPLTNITH